MKWPGLVSLWVLAACVPGKARDDDREMPPASTPSSTAPSPPPKRDVTSAEIATRDPVAPAGMVYIHGGELFAGIDGATRDTGRPQGRLVRVGGFFLDRLEVDVASYSKCQREGKCNVELHAEGRNCNATAKPPRLDHPMNCVTWKEAADYCKAHGKRLPTAVEWELAARGTDRRVYPWGNSLPAEQVCWQGRKGARKSATCPVGSHPEGVSPSGALDMSGNVEEWTTTIIPGAFPAPIYETRGGNYEFDPVDDADWTDRRADLPGSSNPTSPKPTLGFRCMMDAAA